MAELLIHKGANVNAKAGPDMTPLHFAVFSGHQEVIELLISNGANVNAKQRNGATPLHIAAYEGKYELARVLLANGADVTDRLMFYLVFML